MKRYFVLFFSIIFLFIGNSYCFELPWDGKIKANNLNSTNDPSDNYVPTYDLATGKFTWVVNGLGDGTINTIKENDVGVGGTDIITLDFLGADFDLSESPDKEIQIVIAAALTRDTEWNTTTKINTATTDQDFLVDNDIGVTVQGYLGATHDTKEELDALYEGELVNANGLSSAIGGESTGSGNFVRDDGPTFATNPKFTISSTGSGGEKGISFYDAASNLIGKIVFGATDLTDSTQDGYVRFYTDVDGTETEQATFSNSRYDYELLPISWFSDGTTPPEELDDSGTRPPLKYRNFAGATADEDVHGLWQAPPNLDADSKISFRVHYVITNSTTPSSEGVVFALQGASIGDGDATNPTAGSAVTIADTGLSDAQWDYKVTDWSGVVTITDLAAGEMSDLDFYRDQDHASDDYAQDVGVLFVEIRYVKAFE